MILLAIVHYLWSVSALLDLLLDHTTTSLLSLLPSLFWTEDTTMDGLGVIFKLLYLSKDLRLLVIKLEIHFVKDISVIIQILPLLIQVFICPSWISHPSKLGDFGTGTKQKEVNGTSGATSTITIEEEPGFGSMVSLMETVEIDLDRFITFSYQLLSLLSNATKFIQKS